MRLGGYFPKRVVPRPEWLTDPRAGEVCSVSHCISRGPDGWVDQWLHNELGWFNVVADAWAVVPEPDRSLYRLFAYRLNDECFRKGRPEAVLIPEEVKPEPLTEAFVSLGFDCYSKSMPTILGPECSPLSCNGLAAAYPINGHCLLETLENALSAAARFSVEEPEPGDYYIAEVLEWVARGRRTMQ